MERKQKVWLIAAIIVLLLIGGALVFFHSGFWHGMQAYDLLEEWLQQPEQTMQLQLQAQIDGEETTLDTHLNWTTLECGKVLGLEISGVSVYFHDAVVYLENGKGYDFGDSLPDEGTFLKLASGAFSLLFPEKTENGYSIAVSNEKLDDLKQLLGGSIAQRLPERLSVEVLLEEGERGLDGLSVLASGAGAGEAGSSFQVHAELETAALEDMTVPQAVVSSIKSGRSQQGQDIVRLLQGWMRFNSRDSQAMNLALFGDCGPLVLDEELQLHRWQVAGTAIGYIERNGMGLYYTEQKVCSKDGKLLSNQELTVEPTQLIDLVYYLLLNGDLDCQEDTFSLTLDRQGMEAVAYAIVPEAESMGILFTTGSLELKMAGKDIQSVRVQCDGRVDVILAQLDVGVGVELTMSDEKRILPEQVVQALGD